MVVPMTKQTTWVGVDGWVFIISCNTEEKMAHDQIGDGVDGWGWNRVRAEPNTAFKKNDSVTHQREECVAGLE